ncbi:hypothetical protein HY798_00435, partial [Candidatus Falkowbacteria bacterium]|nr:hypothetical protein [Candidatus Falkowbacteria bacterium]
MYKRILISIFLLVAFFAVAPEVVAEKKGALSTEPGGQYEACKGDSGCYGLIETDKTAINLPTSKVGWDIPTVSGQVIGAGLAFIGILFFILMIYGGILWMTAQGNEQQVTKA